MSWCLTTQTILATNAVQSMVQDLRNEMSEKINRIPVSYFDKASVWRFVRSFLQVTLKLFPNALQQSFLQIVNAVFTIILLWDGPYLNLQLAIIVILSIPGLILGAKTSSGSFTPKLLKQQAAILGRMNGFCAREN